MAKCLSLQKDWLFTFYTGATGQSLVWEIHHLYTLAQIVLERGGQIEGISLG